VLRVGVIGAGGVAGRHAEAYAENADAAIVAVADPDASAREALALRHGASAFPSYEDLLADGSVDAVSVCVPHDLHLPVGLAAAAAGVHTLMEKPLALDLAEADAMIDAASAAGIVLMTGFVHRFRAEVLEARRLLVEGAIGTPATALDRFAAPGGDHPPAWVWDRARAGGGVLMYGGIHAVDRLRWLLAAEVESVYARAHRYGGCGDVEDGLLALLTFANGVTACLFENSPPYGGPGGWATEIFGSDGAVRIQTGEWVESTRAGETLTVGAEDERHFHRQIDEFVAAVRERRPPSVTGQDGRAALAVALAIYEAAASGREVRVR
jgi:predicted dehydrogenase